VINILTSFVPQVSFMRRVNSDQMSFHRRPPTFAGCPRLADDVVQVYRWGALVSFTPIKSTGEGVRLSDPQ
jgi:hypothetical protein